MFAIYGKSLKKEYLKKKDDCPISRFESNRNAYLVSPEFFDIQRCHEFIELAKKQTDIRPIYIAEQKHIIDYYGETSLNKKTGQPKVRYQKILAIEK